MALLVCSLWLVCGLTWHRRGWAPCFWCNLCFRFGNRNFSEALDQHLANMQNKQSFHTPRISDLTGWDLQSLILHVQKSWTVWILHVLHLTKCETAASSSNRCLSCAVWEGDMLPSSRKKRCLHGLSENTRAPSPARWLWGFYFSVWRKGTVSLTSNLDDIHTSTLSSVVLKRKRIIQHIYI